MFLNFHCHQTSFSKEVIANIDGQKNSLPPYFSLGIHPENAETGQLDEDLIHLKACVAIGECGLDKNISVDFSSQISCFKKQIELSEQFELPLILHCVKSWNEVVALRRQLKPKQLWIYHGFRKINLATQVLLEGLYIGVGPAILFDERLRQLVTSLPLNRILCETDDDREIQIEAIYTEISRLKNIPLQAVMDEVNTSFKTVFRKWEIG